MTESIPPRLSDAELRAKSVKFARKLAVLIVGLALFAVAYVVFYHRTSS